MYVLSSGRKDSQWADVAFTFSQVTTEHWGWLVLVMCQNYNKISNLYPLPTYLIIFPESASLYSSTGWKRQRKESSEWAHPLRDTDTTIRSETPCVFHSSMPPLVNIKGWLGVWSLYQEGPLIQALLMLLISYKTRFPSFCFFIGKMGVNTTNL